VDELGCGSRALVGGTAALDLGVRTALASVLTLPVGGWAVRSDLRRELRLLELYRELAEQGDPSAVFKRPDSLPQVVERSLDRPSFPGGQATLLRLQSPYTALHPDVRRDYARHVENAVAWAQHWRHSDGPRPTLVVIHGFGASPFWFNSRFFDLPRLYGLGYDVLLYLLPFHGVRQARFAAFSGWGLFAHGIAQFNEALIQAVQDLRLFIDHLESAGTEQVAVTGLSLGGYMTALLAAVDPRPVAVIPNSPVVSIPSLLRQWFPANLLAGLGARAAGIDRNAIDAALAVHSPLSYRPMIPRERRMIIGGLGDRLAPPSRHACCGSTGSVRSCCGFPAATSSTPAAARTSTRWSR
jgi:pimeloyl-ACP methyl ester carboxylesterase